MAEDIDDPLKPFNEVLKPDVRSKLSPWRTLELHHAEIAQIGITDAAPIGVRQLFETAKNLALYSWFVYRFHQPAELCAYGAMEMALREKAARDAPEWWGKFPTERPPALGLLMRQAHKEQWINNEGFWHWRHRQQMAAHRIAVVRQLHWMRENKVSEAASPRFEDFEGQIGDPAYDYISILLQSIPWERNTLAHGSRRLNNGSVGTLEICAELINQLF